MSRNLILWVIDEAHRAEQQVSEASVRRHMPDVDTKCFVVKRETTWYDVYIKTLQTSLNMPAADANGRRGIYYDKFIFLDSDTYLTESISDVFEILDNYDIASTRAPALQTTDMPKEIEIPDAFPEMNTGILAYANTSQVHQLFQWWLDEYYKLFPVSGDNDQAPLRVAMWQQGTKAWVLPSEYNFRAGFGGFASGRVKLLHIRYPHATMEQIEAWANKDGGMRLLSSKDLPK